MQLQPRFLIVDVTASYYFAAAFSSILKFCTKQTKFKLICLKVEMILKPILPTSKCVFFKFYVANQDEPAGKTRISIQRHKLWNNLDYDQALFLNAAAKAIKKKSELIIQTKT